MDIKDEHKKYFAINMDVDTLVSNVVSCEIAAARPSYITFIPQLLTLLDRNNIKATFFIVAKFAQDKEIAKVIQEMADNGHEIANHSCRHNKHLSSMSYEDTYRDIQEADKILTDITVKELSGFVLRVIASPSTS